MVRLHWFIVSFLLASGVARGADAAPIGYTFSLLDGQFSVREMAARGRMLNSVGDARALLRGDIPQAGHTAHGDYSVINFLDPENGYGGHFNGGNPFPGDRAGDDQAFAVRVRGWIDIPQPGVYTFGVNSDDGFRMRVGPLFLRHQSPRFTADSLGTTAFTKAGRYRLKLTYFEQGNGAELELFAARGAYSTFEEGRQPTGVALPPADDTPPGVSVPEPASSAVAGVIALWTLAARRPARADRYPRHRPARR